MSKLLLKEVKTSIIHDIYKNATIIYESQDYSVERKHLVKKKQTLTYKCLFR